jgi:hypothetical protein
VTYLQQAFDAQGNFPNARDSLFRAIGLWWRRPTPASAAAILTDLPHVARHAAATQVEPSRERG